MPLLGTRLSNVGRLVGSAMEALRQRKSLRTGRRPKNTDAEPSARVSARGLAHSASCLAPDSAEAVALRTRSGRQISEAALVDAVRSVGLSGPAEQAGSKDLTRVSSKRKRASSTPAAVDGLSPPAELLEGTASGATPKAPPAVRRRSRASGADSGRQAATRLAHAASAPGDLEAPTAAAAKRAAKKPARSVRPAGETPRLSQKAIALTVGASRDRSVWTEESMQAAMDHLCAADSKLAAVIERCGKPEQLWPKGATNMFASLTRSIVAQQLATQAAFKINGRFLAACKAEKPRAVQPEDVLATPLEDLRACGLSGMKASYIIDLATHFQSGTLSDEAISEMDDEALITELTKVKGIGRWSVDMFAMFHLGRRDVLPIGDLGVRNGIRDLYGLKEAPKPLEMEALTDAWRPYRSLGSYYMWRVIDKKGASQARVPLKEAAAEGSVPRTAPE